MIYYTVYSLNFQNKTKQYNNYCDDFSTFYLVLKFIKTVITLFSQSLFDRQKRVTIC